MSKVVAAVSYRDYVLIFTDDGKVFKLVHDEVLGMTMTLLHRILELDRV